MVERSCSVVYGRCGQQLDKSISVRAMTNVIILSLELNKTENASDICCQLTASNATYSTIVNGTLTDFEATSGEFDHSQYQNMMLNCSILI